MASPNTDLRQRLRNIPRSITTSIIGGVTAAILAIICFAVAGSLDHSISQTYHAVPLDTTKLSQQENVSDFSIMTVPVENELHTAPLRLYGPPVREISYWENNVTHEVSVKPFTSDWAAFLKILGWILGITSALLFLLAISLFIQTLQTTHQSRPAS